MYELKLVRSVLKEDAPFKVLGALSVVNYIEKNCQSRDEQWREVLHEVPAVLQEEPEGSEPAGCE